MERLKQISESADAQLVIMALISCCFIGASLFLIMLILGRKTVKRKHAFLKQKHWKNMQNALATILIETRQEKTSTAARRAYHMLKRATHQSNQVSQWLLEEIMTQKSNLSGESLRLLMHIYAKLGLRQKSLDKLKSSHWQQKAKGLMELEHMHQKRHFKRFYKHLNAKNNSLRRTARLGLTSLAPNPIDFLNHQKEELSEWEQLNLAQRLAQRSKKDLPSFAPYFKHPQPTVVIFCVKMSVKFGFYEDIPKLISLLKHPITDVRLAVITGLSELGAFQANAAIQTLAEASTEVEVIIACLRYLGNVGGKEHQSLIDKMLTHENMQVRMAAVETALKLDFEFGKVNKELEQMIIHHQNEWI